MISPIRPFAVGPLVLLAACAHTAPVERPETGTTTDAATEMRRCVDVDECRDVGARVKKMLLQRREAAEAERLVHKLVEILRHSDATPVIGGVIANCRRGHQASCRALWWAVDRLYLDERATAARANECPLTQALATAMEF